MTIYAVIDTNVIVSAMLSNLSDAATVQVMARVISGEITPLFSKETLAKISWEEKTPSEL